MTISARFRRVSGTGGIVAVLVSLATMWPAGAAQRVSHVAAPYEAAEHIMWASCARPNVAPNCGAAAAADARTGRMDASASVDSGAGGRIPGTAEAVSVGRINQLVDIGNATAATITFSVHVVRANSRWQGSTTADTSLEATAACDGCPLATGGYAHVDGPGDQTVTVVLLRGRDSAHTAAVGISTNATSTVGCDDFCLTPMGMASASAETVLTRLDVELWGLGKPTAPVITTPGPNTTMSPPSGDTVQAVAGTAEPGMAVQLFDGPRVIADVQADVAGRWYSPVDLPLGRHVLRARANGPEGTAMSATYAVQVG